MKRMSAILLTAGLAFGAGVVSSNAASTTPTIFACVKSGSLSSVGTKKPTCAKGSTLLSWAVSGQQGLKGTNGLPGATGPQGPKGDTGLQGIQGERGAQGPAGAASYGGYSRFAVSEDGLTSLLIEPGLLIDQTGTGIPSWFLGPDGFASSQVESARELLLYKEPGCVGSAHFIGGPGKLNRPLVNSWGGEGATPSYFLEQASASNFSEFTHMRVNGDIWADNPTRLQRDYGLTVSQVGQCLPLNSKVGATIQDPELGFSVIVEWTPPIMGQWHVENR